MSKSDDQADFSVLRVSASHVMAWGQRSVEKARSVDELAKVYDTIDALAVNQKSIGAPAEAIAASNYVSCYCVHRMTELITAGPEGFEIAGDGHPKAVPGGT